LRRLVAILNPQADRGRTGALADALREALGSRFELRLEQTTERREATRLAFDAAGSGCEAVIAIGGDGTVHEVMNGLMRAPSERRPALGIVPAGSGNDVAFALGITKSLEQAAEAIERGSTRAVDIGHIRTDRDDECFCINNVGLLLEGEINRASHRLRWPRGSGLYVRAMLQTLARPLPAATLRLTIDGRAVERRATILSMANGPRSGGKFQLMPDAAVDDGTFDYLLAPPVNRLKLLWNVRHALAGRRLEGAWIERGRFQEMAIASDEPLTAHVDGEPWLTPDAGVRAMSISVTPRVLRVLCPTAATPSPHGARGGQ
jgi:YegS/Rv2252/BmrU family lipid kinase